MSRCKMCENYCGYCVLEVKGVCNQYTPKAIDSVINKKYRKGENNGTIIMHIQKLMRKLGMDDDVEYLKKYSRQELEALREELKFEIENTY